MHTSLQLKNMPVEFINVVALNPLISSCDIKVLYTGANRNKSYFTKEVVKQMAASLPNVPIVGEFLEECEDYGDHGQEMIINSKGVKYIKRTKPFGVVPSDTKMAWQMFIDDDGVEREYLMCEGFLWTGRYPETQRILERGNGQSMELHADSIRGNWAIPPNEVDEYFIVDEAVFSALCILGEDVEPCFEGANITAPTNILENSNYSLNKSEFNSEMTEFMLDLKVALNSDKGGEIMKSTKQIIEGQESVNGNIEDSSTVEKDFAFPTEEEKKAKEEEDAKKKAEESAMADEEAKKLEEEKAKKDAEDSAIADEEKAKKDAEDCAAKDEEKAKADAEEKAKKDEEEKAKYTLEDVVEYTALKAEYDALVIKMANLETETFSLREMKSSIETKNKEAMIATFFMLDEEDLKEVKENISTYSLAEIESKLSVIAVRKKVNFNLDDSAKSNSNLETPIISFNADATDNTPAWLKAVDSIVKNRI